LESASVTNPDVSKSELNGVFAVITACMAIIFVSVAIVGHWGTYSLMERSLAILFVLNLLAFPLRLIFTKKGRITVLRAAGSTDLSSAYMWVLLATWVFNHSLS